MSLAFNLAVILPGNYDRQKLKCAQRLAPQHWKKLETPEKSIHMKMVK